MNEQTIKVESNIPLPADPRGRPSKYPWREMKVGQSFFVPGKNTTDIGAVRCNAQRTTGRKFTSRTVDGGVRVWRVK